MHCLPTFNLSDRCQPNSHHMRDVYLDVCMRERVCVCARACLVVFRSFFFYFVSFNKKKSGHLMSSAITDDIRKPVCLSQDRRNCLPARMRIIPMSLKRINETQISREEDTSEACSVLQSRSPSKCPRPLPFTDLKQSSPPNSAIGEMSSGPTVCSSCSCDI